MLTSEAWIIVDLLFEIRQISIFGGNSPRILIMVQNAHCSVNINFIELVIIN